MSSSYETATTRIPHGKYGIAKWARQRGNVNCWLGRAVCVGEVNDDVGKEVYDGEVWLAGRY